MRKKLLIILLVCILSGCDKVDKDIQISELKYNDDYIIGRIKNQTSKNYNLDIIIQTKSGTLVNNAYCHDTIKPYEAKDFKCLALDLDDTYSFKIKKIEKEIFETPKLTYGEIDESTLKYYFENIYNSHYLFMTNLDIESKFPKFDSIEYKNNNIEFKNTLNYDDQNTLLLIAKYSTKNEELESIHILIGEENQEIENDIILAFSLHEKDIDNSIKISYVLRKISEFGKCTSIGDLCYAKYKSNNVISYIASSDF